MFYDDDADSSLLEGKTVAIIGYGSQGHAHALNLKDSGVSVVVGLRADSGSVARAQEHGLRVGDAADAASEGDIVTMLVPDELHRQVWESSVKAGIASGNLLMFGHGFSIHYQEVVPPPDVDVALVAPKGPGHLVRRQYLEGSGVPGLVAIHQNATGTALQLARSEEHTSELQSRVDLVCRLLLEKKNRRADRAGWVDLSTQPALARHAALWPAAVSRGMGGLRQPAARRARAGASARPPHTEPWLV